MRLLLDLLLVLLLICFGLLVANLILVYGGAART